MELAINKASRVRISRWLWALSKEECVEYKRAQNPCQIWDRGFDKPPWPIYLAIADLGIQIADSLALVSLSPKRHIIIGSAFHSAFRNPRSAIAMLPSLSTELERLRSEGLYRSLRQVEGPPGPHCRVMGVEYLNFCSNDYLGLATHPTLKAAAAKALEVYGCSATASRLLSGSMPPHEELETRLADFLNTEAALTFPTGYMANLGAITSLAGSEDVVFSDRLNHASIVDGCRLSRAKIIVYDHCDPNHLEELMQSTSNIRRRVIVTDGVFSMDGDVAPLPEIIEIAQRNDAILIVDDAHATGVLGPNGRGSPEHFDLPGVDVLTSSGSIALGSTGGFVAGRQDLIDLLINRARTFVYTTALSPDACAATAAALDLINADPSIRGRLWRNLQIAREGLCRLEFDLMNSRTQIIPILIGDPNRTMAISEALLEQRILLSGIRPPTVPENQSRLRLSLTSEHSQEDIEHLLEALETVRSI